MTDQSDRSTPQAPSRPVVRECVLVAYIVLVAIAAILATAWTVVDEIGADAGYNLIGIGLFALLLFFATNTNANWLRFGPGGEVTPGWAFAFSIALLGSTTAAIAAMGLTMVFADITSQRPGRQMIFNAAQVALSLALGGAVLSASGVDRMVTDQAGTSLAAVLAVVAAGLVVFMTSWVLVCVVLSLHFGTSLRTMLSDGLKVSITADGALLALAPIFVVTVEFSLLLVPLLVAAALVVNRTARQSHARAHDASHDPLTRLLNRRGFAARVDEVLYETDARAGVLLLIDLDGFKQINDQLGHQTGDALLVGLADRMADVFPGNAVVARLGGDEFSIFIPDADNLDVTKDRIEHWRAQLSRPVDIDGFPLAARMSIGVACAPEHGTALTQLLHAADTAMYASKQYDSGVTMHGATASNATPSRVELLRELSTAIDASQIEMRYEPQRNVDTGDVDLISARMVWCHGTHGEIPAEEFVGPAAQTELIGLLTEFVVERAARDLSSLGRTGMRLAIQIPPRTLHDAHFPSDLMSMLDRAGVSPDRVELEMGERVLTEHNASTRDVIDRLRQVGVTITADDFGADDSSFATLQGAAIDRIKLDRAFVRRLTVDPSNALILGATLSVAAGTGIEVVADGADTAEIVRILSTAGCRFVQGLEVAPAMTCSDLALWLDELEAPQTQLAIAR